MRELIKERTKYIINGEYSIEISYNFELYDYDNFYSRETFNLWAELLTLEEIEEITDMNLIKYTDSKQIEVDNYDEKIFKGYIIFAGIDEDDCLTFKVKFE